MMSDVDFDIELIVKTTRRLDIDYLISQLPTGYSFDDESDDMMYIVRVSKDQFVTNSLSEEMIGFVEPLSNFLTSLNYCESQMRIGIFDTNYISHVDIQNLPKLAFAVTSLDITIYPTHG